MRIHSKDDEYENGTSSENEEDKEETEDENTEEDEEYNDYKQLENDYTNPFWKYLLEVAYNRMNEFPETIQEMKSSEYFPELVDLIKKYYDYFCALHFSLSESCIEEKIVEYQTSLSRKGMDCEDAQELAWQNMRFLFKRLVDNNIDVFEKEAQRRD